ncbi:MAG: hypothetical protein RJB26_1417, partial [Pseudomonadota bacterium]
MIELYHWEPNGVFLKPLVTLAEKGAAYTSHWFDPTAFEQFGAGFPANTESALQLEREGPLLVVADEVLSSSSFQLEFINEAVPGPDLFPVAAHDRYRVRAWAQYLGLGLGHVVSALGCARFLRPVLAARDGAALRAQLAAIEPLERRNAWLAVLDGAVDEAAWQQRLVAPLARLEKALTGADWLAGPTYSLADIDAYALVAPLRTLAPARVNAAATAGMVVWMLRIVYCSDVSVSLMRSCC